MPITAKKILDRVISPALAMTALVALASLAVGEFGVAHAARGASVKSDMLLWYRQPGEKWLEAMPMGNGLIGGDGFWRHSEGAYRTE